MTQATPQEKKIRDLRSTGKSLREIAEMLNITRKKVETILGIETEQEAPAAKPTSEKKAPASKSARKGK